MGVTAETQKKREEEKEKRRRRKLAQRAQAAAAATPQIDMEAAEAEPPNRVLFVSNLPEETTDAMLTMLFSQFSGFQEARRAVGGIGFVEYETENQATAAKAAYNGFKLTPTHAMTITYAKK